MKKQRGSSRVLIVDDSPDVREALRWALQDTEEEVLVDEAGDIETALALARRQAPDIVLLDIDLPSADGYAVAHALKALAHPPRIIFLSIHADASTRQQAADAGGDAFVAKITGWQPLLRQIRRFLRR